MWWIYGKLVSGLPDMPRLVVISDFHHSQPNYHLVNKEINDSIITCDYNDTNEHLITIITILIYINHIKQ